MQIPSFFFPPEQWSRKKCGVCRCGVDESVVLWALDCELLWCPWVKWRKFCFTACSQSSNFVLRYCWTQMHKPKVNLEKGRLCSENAKHSKSLLMPHLWDTVINYAFSAYSFPLAQFLFNRTHSWLRPLSDSLSVAQNLLLLAFLAFKSFSLD